MDILIGDWRGGSDPRQEKLLLAHSQEYNPSAHPLSNVVWGRIQNITFFDWTLNPLNNLIRLNKNAINTPNNFHL